MSTMAMLTSPYLLQNWPADQSNSMRVTCRLGLIIVTARQDLLARWVQVECVLKLGHIGTASVAQGRVWIDDALVAQVLECHLVLGLTKAIQIPAQKRWASFEAPMQPLSGCNAAKYYALGAYTCCTCRSESR